MPITREELQDLYSLAREHWLEAEANRLAYQRAYEKALTLNSRLQWVTIGTAVATAVLGGMGSNRWVTTLIGALTAAVAAINKVLDPAGRSQKYWNTMRELEKFKNDMVTTAVTLSKSENLLSGTKLFDQFKTRMDGILAHPVSRSDSDRERARKVFTDTTIANLIARLATLAPAAVSFSLPDAGPDEGIIDVGMAEDAPDIVAPVRVRAS